MPETAFVFSPRVVEHDTGPNHPERPDRGRAISRAVRLAGLIESPDPFPDFEIDFGLSLAKSATKLIEIEPAPIDERWIRAVHPNAMIERARRACAHAGVLDQSDTPTCPASFEIARLSAGGAIAACDFVMGGKDRRAFSAGRPPGHHAEIDRSMGFCLFNNIAIAARYLQQQHGVKKIAIVDFDVHHGNGTQDVFEADDSVLFISIHQDPRTLYPGSGFASEDGTGVARGYTLNVPMPPGSGDEEYAKAFEQIVVPKLDAFRPEVLLISAGFDGHADDPLAQIELSDDGFEMMTRTLVNVAERHCGGQVVSVLEGGYNLRALGRGVVRHLIALGE